MSCRVQIIQEQENPDLSEDSRASGICAGKKPMHPDDFEAHLAWVNAKRIYDYVHEKTLSEKPVGHWMIG
jgi:hypothetical protein